MISTNAKQNLTYFFLLIVCGATTFWIYTWTHTDWIVFREAENLYAKKQYEQASQLYVKSLQAGIPSSKLKLHLADSYVSIGKFNEAVPLYRDLLRENPSDKHVRLALARALSWLGDLKAAKDEYNKLLETKNENVQK